MLTRVNFAKGCLSPIRIIIPKNSILDPSESAAVVGHVAEDAADQETAVVVMGVVADTRSVVVDTAAG